MGKRTGLLCLAAANLMILGATDCLAAEQYAAQYKAWAVMTTVDEFSDRASTIMFTKSGRDQLTVRCSPKIEKGNIVLQYYKEIPYDIYISFPDRFAPGDEASIDVRIDSNPSLALWAKFAKDGEGVAAYGTLFKINNDNVPKLVQQLRSGLGVRVRVTDRLDNSHVFSFGLEGSSDAFNDFAPRCAAERGD